MGFLDRLLGRGRQAMGDVARGGSLNPEQVMQQQEQAMKSRAESAPQEAEAKAQRAAERKAQGTK